MVLPFQVLQFLFRSQEISTVMKILLASGIAVLYAAFQMPAEPPMKMGLWEITSTIKMNMPDMPPAMANMPGMGARTTKIHSCLTKENYEKTFSQQGPQAKNCTVSNQKFSGKTYSLDLSCNDGKMTGHVENTFDSPNSGHSKSHIVMNGGQSITMDGDSTMTFLGADCGSVTPDKPQIMH
jgi:hypothetical protein